MCNGPFFVIFQLDLSNNGLAPSHVADLSEVLTGVKRLRILNLSLNFLTDLSEKQVSHIISNLADLRELKMRSCFITGEFFESMTSTQRLEHLDVSFNRLGITGIEKLALCLQKSHYLKSLDLSGCVKAKHSESKSQKKSSIWMVPHFCRFNWAKTFLGKLLI